MGTVRAVLIVASLLAAWFPVPRLSGVVRAQSAPSLPCTSQPAVIPMAGHYTGPWHAEGDYTFTADFPANGLYPAQERVLEMKIIVDGTLDVTIDGNGQVTGTATGNVNAPIYHDGKQDISSGIGTISGPVSGVFSAGGSLLVLAQPTIDMHWGTFGGHAVETFPVMPNYQLSVGKDDCVSGQGTVAEQGFPTMNITNDSTGQLTQAPGVGAATGTWQLSDDQSATFQQLAQQVSAFIGTANSLLGSSSLAVSQVQQQILQPLQTLEQSINAHPGVARCLWEQLGAWETSVIPGLFQRAAGAAAGGELLSLRHAGDLLRATSTLNRDCKLPDGGAAGTIAAADGAALDRAVGAHDWPDAALLAREIILLDGDAGRAVAQQRLAGDLHSIIQTAQGSARLDAARFAFALGDDGDAALVTAGVSQLRPLATSLPWHPVHRSKHKRSKKKRKKVRATPQPRPTATARPTPTPVPLTLPQVLASGATPVSGQATRGTLPTFTWQPIAGATRYIVIAAAPNAPHILWAWSGSGTSVTYGDTAIAGEADTANDGWPVALPSGATWSVLAVNPAGGIVGVQLRQAL